MSDNQFPPVANSLQLDQQLCFPLYAASRLMTRRYKPYLDKLGITYPQYLVLMVLWEESPVPLKTIGEKLYLSSNTLTPLLKRLATMALIKRERSTEDERELYVHLTETGQALQEQARCVLAPFSENKQADQAQLQQLKRQLNQLIDFLA